MPRVGDPSAWAGPSRPVGHRFQPWFAAAGRRPVWADVLNACTSGQEANGVPPCADRPGVDRAAVHARVLAAVEGFLAERAR